MAATNSYVPGVCNINTAEVAYRRKAMWFGIGLAVIVLVVCLVAGVAWWGRALLLFVPTYIAAIGFLQVRNRFCVSYGASGQQNATDGNSAASKISNQSDRDADKAKSRKMNLQALLITIVVLVVAAILPTL